MNKYDVTIGIEIHLELNTKTKMFSPTPIHFNAIPNTFVNEIDLGYPGSLPSVNKQCVIKAIMLAKALKMEIDQLLRFDRKNYFYPDLPKGYQITQQFFPIGKNGLIKIDDQSQAIDIKIERIHLEEDTAKSLHQGDFSLLDYNRAGNPLIEIVTKPCLKNSNQVAKYVNEIKLIALALNISNAKMEEGSMRVDVNLSLADSTQTNLGTKVEIKNLNSVNNIVKAIEYEIALQNKMLNENLQIVQCTKRWDEKGQKTVLMRLKNDSVDYKFFPEPNILPICLTDDFISQITLNELPWEKRARYFSKQIANEYVEQLVNSQDKATFLDQIFALNQQQNNQNFYAKVFFSEIVSLANRENKLIGDLQLDANEVSYAFNLALKGDILLNHLKLIIPHLINQKSQTKDIIEKLNLKQINDKDQLNAIIKEIINQNSIFIKNNIDRTDRVFKFILGKVMQQTNGQANMQLANEIVKKLMGK